MNTTFLIAVFLCFACSVGLTSLAVYLFAESKWHKHPLARYSHQRAASFSASF